MDALDCLKTRRSIRCFDAGMISEEDIWEILECAIQAPSARNIRPFEFIVVRDLENLVWLTDTCEYGKFIKDSAFTVLVVCQDTKYFLEDGSAATTNLLNAAHALGYGGCWIAGDKKPYCTPILERFGVPSTHKLISIVAVGKTSVKTSKKPVDNESKIHWEKY